MINVFKKIWSFSIKEKGNLQKSIVIGFLNAIFNSLLVTALYVVLKAIVENSVSTNTAWTAFIIMAVSIVGKIVTQYFSQLQRTHAGYFMVADKRINIGEKLKSVPMGYFNQNSLGQITAIETTILNDVESAVPVVLVTTLGGFLNSLVFALFMLVFDWRMGAVTLLGIVVFLLVTSAMEKKSREGVPARQEAQTILVEAVLETIQGMSVVKAFDLDNNLDKKVDRAIEESFKKNEKLEKAMTPYVAVQQLVLYVFGIALMFCAITFYLNGSMELTKSLIMVVCSFMVYEQLKVAGSCVANMRIAEHSIDKANKIDDVPTMDEGGKDIVPTSTEIKFKNVDFAYEKKKILDNVSFTIPEKKMTAIVGPSGSGKTTLCSMIPRFWDVDAGSVSIGGVNVKDYTLNSLMKNVSMVFQNVYLFADTIENNIKFGKAGKTITVILKTYVVIDYIRRAFANLGYVTKENQLNAAMFGVPQTRERFIMIGVLPEYKAVDEISEIQPLITNDADYITVRTAIGDLKSMDPTVHSMDAVQTRKYLPKINSFYRSIVINTSSPKIYNHVCTESRQDALDRFKVIAPGENFHSLPDDLKKNYENPKRTQNTVYRRLSYEFPSDTVVNVRKSMWIHPELHRAISAREAARLQSFPDDYVFYGTKDSVYQQIGNAVPPFLGRAVAEKVLEVLGQGTEGVESLKEIYDRYLG